MRIKMKGAAPAAALTRILAALEQELIDASDEEIMEAAKDLGMNPYMKGSAAFLGLKYAAKPRLSDFFDLAAFGNARIEIERIADAARREGKDPADK